MIKHVATTLICTTIQIIIFVINQLHTELLVTVQQIYIN